MGYILPINHYQYNDYQIRANAIKRIGATSISKPYKAVLEKHHQEIRNRFERYHAETSSTTPRKKIQHDYKGKHFHAIV
ncbi:hypothetical protein [Oceanobacillus sp. Castelsardo]|uniref:hypothetical protein n=1 Tax=Oceanobacillus sp. Castelsardo TaxID=1851204 RepID=UPI0008384889|nr:hypothetical protein [Oceanobacillus sp. Castelsardo]